MATTANAAWVTQTDLFKTIGPDKRVQAVAQTLMTYNEIIQDMIYTEANGNQFHQATQQSALPTVTRSKINEMITPTKALHDQVTFILERIESVLAIDKRLLEINPDSLAFKAIQSKSHLQAISQQLATDIFYANTNQDETQAMGLASLYSDMNNSKYGGDQIVDGKGDGAGAQSSIWFIDWGDDAITAIYPPGTKAGIQFEDLGENLLGNHTDGFMRAVAAWFSVRWGMSVVNPKHCVRICNIDYADMVAGTSVNLPELMIQAEERMPPEATNVRIYMNRLVRERLRIEARKEANVTVNFDWGDFMGKRVMFWNGIPIRRCDAIVNTETIVAAV